MKLKANHNLLLPDGKTEVKVGEEFEYTGDITPFKECVSVIEADIEPEKVPEQDPEEAAIREKGRLLGIKSYHNKNIEKLKAEIAEKEAALADENKETPDADPTPAPAPASTPAHVEGETETAPKTTPEEGGANV